MTRTRTAPSSTRVSQTLLAAASVSLRQREWSLRVKPPAQRWCFATGRAGAGTDRPGAEEEGSQLRHVHVRAADRQDLALHQSVNHRSHDLRPTWWEAVEAEELGGGSGQSVTLVPELVLDLV